MASTILSKRLKELRESHHYTQTFVSSYLNIERPTYSNYELGKRVPTLELIIDIADFYHISIDELVRSPQEEHGVPLSLTSEELLLIREFRQLNLENQKEVLNYTHYRQQL